MIGRLLARDIGLALLFKLVALVALYGLFFNASHRTKVTPVDMAILYSDATPRR